MKCSICEKNITDKSLQQYNNIICLDCDKRALGKEGDKAKHMINKIKSPTMNDCLEIDDGDNPVYIDGKKCWRRYKFGSWVTMFDPYDCDSIEEFYEKN
tara:strand:- start:345 stop:641 length:297 start_codon:yes stop_codon:yes gene_type:complete